MATRNLTAKFDQYRSRSKSLYQRPSARSGDDGHALLPDNEPASITNAVPPEWVDIVESVQADVAKIKQSTRQLQALHSKRLKVTFDDDEGKYERDIEILTQEISRLFHRCETSLKRIATVGNDGHLTQEERLVRYNVMRGLAVEIQSLSKTFRQQQKDFLMRLKSQETDLIVDMDDNKVSLTEALDQEGGLTPENMQQLAQLDEKATQREHEIIQIAKSVNELAQIFKELNVLIIEQGSIVDRIDYNMEQVITKVRAGRQELEKAEEVSKKSRSIMCIIALAILVVILIIVLAYKHSN